VSGTQEGPLNKQVAGWIAGGGLAAVIFAAGPHAVSMFEDYLEHRQEMAIIERSRATWEEFLVECGRDCGRAWKGSCIEKGEHCQEEVSP